MSINLHIEDLHRLLAAEIQPEGGYFSQYLSLAYTQGHSAIRHEAGKLYPSPSSVFTIEGKEYLSAEELEFLEKKIVDEIERGLFNHCIQNDLYLTLQGSYNIEMALAKEIIRLGIYRNEVQNQNLNLAFDPRLNLEQKAAIEGAMRSSLSTITGGPGTGKTFTAGLLLSLIAQNQTKKLHVALLAPTGRAVKNLQASILRFFTAKSLPVIEAKTIHRALSEKATYLPYNIVIIDEASMIDSFLMLQLLRRLFKGTKIIFLGDSNQLPSIDPGQPFSDLIEAKTPLIPSFLLENCLRTDCLQLKALTKSLVSSNSQGFLEIIRNPTEQIQFIDLDTTQEKDLINLLKKEVFNPWGAATTLQEAQGLLGSTALLCAVRGGHLGVEALNSLGEQHSKSKFRPVISTKNNYQLQIMNSDLGTLDTTSNLVYFKEATVPDILCSNLEKAYAMTVHKSQGSEFDTVIFMLPKGTICDIKLLYTAITRAKRRLFLAASSTALQKSLQINQSRESLLAHILSTSLIPK